MSNAEKKCSAEFFNPAQKQLIDQLRFQLDEFVPFSGFNHFQNVSIIEGLNEKIIVYKLCPVFGDGLRLRFFAIGRNKILDVDLNIPSFQLYIY